MGVDAEAARNVDQVDPRRFERLCGGDAVFDRCAAFAVVARAQPDCNRECFADRIPDGAARCSRMRPSRVEPV